MSRGRRKIYPRLNIHEGVRGVDEQTATRMQRRLKVVDENQKFHEEIGL